MRDANPLVGSVWESRKKERARLDEGRSPVLRIICGLFGASFLIWPVKAMLDGTIDFMGAVVSLLALAFAVFFFGRAFNLGDALTRWRFDRLARRARHGR